MDNENKEYLEKVKKVTDAIVFEMLTSAFRHFIIAVILGELIIDVFFRK